MGKKKITDVELKNLVEWLDEINSRDIITQENPLWVTKRVNKIKEEATKLLNEVQFKRGIKIEDIVKSKEISTIPHH